MEAIFNTITPIFLIIIAGILLRRSPIIDSAGWSTIEQLTYWVLYPALVFKVVMKVDFGTIHFTEIAIPFAIVFTIICVLLLSVLPVLQYFRLIAPWEFSTVFQSAVHWNGYISIAIAGKMFDDTGLSTMVFIIAIFMFPINAVSAIVTVLHAEEPRPRMTLGRFIRGNPVLVATIIAMTLRLFDLHIFGPVQEGMNMLGRAAFGVGLLSVGASIKPINLLSIRFTLWFPILIKLIVFPGLLMLIAQQLGVQGMDLLYLTLCVAVPATTHGYLLARQLGGDAPLYAVITTWQTALSFFTIPLMLWCAAQLAGG